MPSAPLASRAQRAVSVRTPATRFEEWKPDDEPAKRSRKPTVNRSALRALWTRTEPAADGPDDDQGADDYDADRGTL